MHKLTSRVRYVIQPPNARIPVHAGSQPDVALMVHCISLIWHRRMMLKVNRFVMNTKTRTDDVGKSGLPARTRTYAPVSLTDVA